MTDGHDAGARRPQTHAYTRTFSVRGPWAPLVGLLVLAPALLAVLSLAALLVGGGALAALLLPALLRHRGKHGQPVPGNGGDCIELDREQYRRIGTTTERMRRD